MKVYLHADDFGLTKKITDDILECIDARVLNSVSIMANGYAFDYAAEEIVKRGETNINLVLHLNLDQGKALSGAPLLSDKHGYLNKGFEGIFLRGLIYKGSLRERFKQELFEEIEQQIVKAIPLFEKLNLPLKVDGERCTHLVPVVFDVLMRLNERYPMSNIRIVNEPWGFVLMGHPQSFFTAGVLKLAVLRLFTYLFGYEQKLKARSISFQDYTFSVVKSGEMTKEFVAKALNYLGDRNRLQLEIVFHPFKPAVNDLTHWSNRSAYKAYFNSDSRGKEKAELLQHKAYFISLKES